MGAQPIEAGAADAAADAAPGADAASLNCSFELCAPYTCDPRWDACRARCSEDAHCIDGHFCESGSCVGSECTEDTAQEKCGAYACERGVCADDCSQSGCAEGFYCRGDTSECVPRCTTREDAVCEGFVCDLDVNECEPICAPGTIECAEGYTCNAAQVCVAP